MSEKTGLENQEDEVKKTVLFGNPQGLNASDKSMLEMSDTNRLVYDQRQSELQIGVLMLHEALVATDNRNPVTRRVQDSQTGQWRTERRVVDHWKWQLNVDHLVRANQLTIKGYSRSQHLRQNANQEPLTVEAEQSTFWTRLFGGR